MSLLVLIFGLLGLSTQVLARTACVELDDGGRWCWEYEEYNVSLSPDDFNQGYYVPPDGNPVGGDGSVQHDFIEVPDSIKVPNEEDNPYSDANCGSDVSRRADYAWADLRGQTISLGVTTENSIVEITYVSTGERENFQFNGYLAAQPVQALIFLGCG